MSSSRSVAWHCLQRIDHHGAYANLVLPAQLGESTLDRRDRAFVTELVYGTTRMRRALDASTDRFLSREPQPEIRSLLRLGAYQLMFTGVAAHAAVSETVALAPKSQRGFVNAILRNIARTPMVWPYRAAELSYPDWIVGRLTDELGEPRADAVLEAMNRPGAAHDRGDGYIQDPGSQWVVAATGAMPGERVLDVCAAPGGKATGMAAAGAWVVGADLQAHRARLVAGNAERLGSAVSTIIADGTEPPFAAATFDRVLLDAPCSGLGTLGRRPDARWRIQPSDVDELVALQARLLRASAALVRPGGSLIYSVCTLLAAESTDHQVPDGFTVDASQPPGPWEPVAHGWRLTPDVADADGMILIRLRR